MKASGNVKKTPKSTHIFQKITISMVRTKGDKMNVQTYIKPAFDLVKKESPKILMALGTASFITTIILVNEEAPKAKTLLEKKAEEKGEELTFTEKVKEVAPIYIPAIGAGAVSLLCFAGSQHINMARNAALVAAYKLSESNLAEFKDKTLKTVGESKLNDIKDAIAKDRIRTQPAIEEEIIATGKGDTRCYDCISGRYFFSDMETIRKAQNDLNYQLFAVGSQSLNDFYDLIGLPWIKVGDKLGWNIGVGHDDPLEIRFTSTLDDKGRPVLVLNYDTGLLYWGES